MSFPSRYLSLTTDVLCQVPLDWQNPTQDARAILAIIKLPATDMEDYRGPMFFNPGKVFISQSSLIFGCGTADIQR